MLKSSNSLRAARAGRRIRFVAGAALAALLAPMIAMSGIVADESGRVATGASRKPALSGYVLRCWQEGRLILEENHVSLPPNIDIGSSKLQVLDRNNHPVYIAETKNATCLVRARPAERGVLPY